MATLNPLGEVPFQYNNKEMMLSFSTMALKRLERTFDMSVTEIGEMLGDTKRFRVEYLVTMFWVGMLDNQPDTTMEEAETILTHQTATQTMQLVMKAYQMGFPAEEGGAVRPTEAAKPNGGGTTSLPHGKPQV